MNLVIKENPRPIQTDCVTKQPSIEPFNVTTTTQAIEIKGKKGKITYISVPEWLKSLNTNGRGGT